MSLAERLRTAVDALTNSPLPPENYDIVVAPSPLIDQASMGMHPSDAQPALVRVEGPEHSVTIPRQARWVVRALLREEV